jgi:hypothetical protein
MWRMLLTCQGPVPTHPAYTYLPTHLPTYHTCGWCIATHHRLIWVVVMQAHAEGSVVDQSLSFSLASSSIIQVGASENQGSGKIETCTATRLLGSTTRALEATLAHGVHFTRLWNMPCV